MKKNNSSAFTLIELVVAVTILSIIMLSVFVIYTNLINVNRKLEQTRILQDQTRLITETIAADIRGSGINFDVSSAPNLLATNSWNQYLLQQKNSNWDFTDCLITEKNYPCQIMSKIDTPLTNDSVDIQKLTFNITWASNSGATNTTTEWKVQLVFDIGIAPKKWVSSDVVKASVITVQTTISEKIYKEN
jgi:prepilin-type N-terminal cleavage/methylation domain-containing protein